MSHLPSIKEIGGVTVIGGGTYTAAKTFQVQAAPTKTKTVSNVALTTNVATLTTSTPHGFIVGESVVVSGLTNTFFNGTYVIASTPSTTTFTYALTHANFTSAADSGTATVSQTANIVEWVDGNGTSVTTVDPTGRINIGNDTFINSSFVAAFKSTNSSTQMQITSSNGTVQFANFLGNAYVQSVIGKNVQLFAGSTLTFDASSTLMTIPVPMQVNSSVFSNNNANASFLMNSAGSNYAMIQNDAANVWSIATGTSLSLGSPIIQWTNLGQVTMTPLAATTKGLIVKAFASQSANLIECENSSGTPIFIVAANGCPSAPDGTHGERFGSGAVASGSSSAAFGWGAAATDTYGVAIGTSAAAAAATAVGGAATASGNASIAIGGQSSATGVTSIAIGSTTSSTHDHSIIVGYSAASTASEQLVIGQGDYGITHGYFGRGVTDATPGSFTLHATGGSGANIAGADLVMAGGKGTGTGLGGSFIVQTAAAGSTGSSLNALVTRITIDSTGLTTLWDGGNLAVGTSTGTKIGTSTSQKIALWNATPIVQPANSVELVTVLTNIGLRASGGNPDLNIGTGAITSGSISTNYRVGPIQSNTDGATITFDLNASDFHTVTLGGNRTLALSNAATGKRFTLRLTQDGSGGHTVTWFSGITWFTSDGNPPVLSSGASKTTVVSFVTTGSGAYDGFLVGAQA